MIRSIQAFLRDERGNVTLEGVTVLGGSMWMATAVIADISVATMDLTYKIEDRLEYASVLSEILDSYGPDSDLTTVEDSDPDPDPDPDDGSDDGDIGGDIGGDTGQDDDDGDTGGNNGGDDDGDDGDDDDGDDDGDDDNGGGWWWRWW